LGIRHSSRRNRCNVKIKRNEENDVTAIYGRKLKKEGQKFAIEFSGGLTLMDGE
jgi:hypothetical protein